MTEDCLFAIAFLSSEIPPLTVLRLEGQEAMNDLFTFEVVVCAVDVDPAAVEARLLGARALMSIAVPGGPPRTVAGLVTDAAILGRTEGERQSFRLRVTPLAWLLTRRRNSRIFQDKTAPEIASIVLGEHGVPHRMTLVERYPVREYCVQYEESDWEFVTRLLAEEALFFWFEHPADESGSEVLTVADSVVAYAPIAGSSRLRYRHDQGGALDLGEDMVTELRSRSGIETTAFTIRDYDFARPGLDLSAGGVAPLVAAASAGSVPLEHYEHHGDYEETDVDPGHVRKSLEQLRARARTAEGTSVCRRLLPGHTFDLVDHDVAALDRTYVVTAASHAGVAPGVAGSQRLYTNRFELVAADTPFPPPRPARRVKQALESAVVVGPAGHEIHCDEHGRVKVQFHWDREGKRNERSSCFLRVATAWAGAGFGHQLVPRMGMEVLVSFLGGDPDRPIVTGCVPNAHTPPPHVLPQSKTRSGIRTRSTPGGGGANELAFEDLAGAEQVYVKAQRNFDVAVGLDSTHAIARHATETIGADLRTSVGGHRRDTVGGDHRVRIEGARTSEVLGADLAQIGMLRRTRIGGSDDLGVTGAAVAEIGGNRTVRVGGSHETSVQGNRVFTVNGRSSVSVHGPSSSTYSGPCSVNAARGIALTVGSKKAPASAQGALSGDLVLRGGGIIDVSAGRQMRFRVGSTVLTLLPRELRIDAERITLNGKSIVATAANSVLSLAEEATLHANAVKLASRDNAILELDKEAKLDGNKVRIKPGLAAEMKKREEREEAAKELDTLSVQLFDLTGELIKSAPYEVSFPGYLDEGTADNGSVEIPAFPDVETARVRWGRPNAARGEAMCEPYEFEMEVYLKTDAGDSSECLRRKLNNLGHRGASLHEAIRHYQASTGASITGSTAEVEGEIAGRHDGAAPAPLAAE